MVQLVRQGLSPALVQVVRFLPVAVFLVLGISVIRAAPGERRRVDWLLAAFLLLHVGVVLARFDAWPFSPYRMMAVDARREDPVRTMVAFRAVGRDGREWKVDPQAFAPLFPQAVMGWFETAWARATPADRDAAVAFLFRRVEEARRQRAAGGRPGNEKLLGALAAPDTNPSGLPPAQPDEPYVGLRVYRFFWKPGELAAHPESVGRRLLAEHRAS